MNNSPDKFSTTIKRYKEALMGDPENQSNIDMLDFILDAKKQRLIMELDPEWQKNNMEYDLRTSDYIIEKCKDHIYAQHLYASMCNNDFIKNDIWPLLKGETWGCSWRRAGGIIADIRQKGDYIDWYCTGISNSDELSDEQLNDLSEQEKANYLEMKAYVPEGVITDEIRDDLFKLGWLVKNESTQS